MTTTQPPRRGHPFGPQTAFSLTLVTCLLTSGLTMAEPVRKPATHSGKQPAGGKSTSITIASPEDEARAAKNLTILDNAGPRAEEAKKRAETAGKTADDTANRYAKAESPVKEAADKYVSVLRDSKTINEELAEAYRTGNASKVESMLEKMKANSIVVSRLREAPGIRTSQVALSLEETATREKATSALVSPICDQWIAARKTAAEAAKVYGDVLMLDGAEESKVEEARDEYRLASEETSALFNYMRNMLSIKQRQNGATVERMAQLAQAEQLANEWLAATRAQTAATVKAAKLIRQFDESIAEARKAVVDLNAAQVKPPASRTTSVRQADTLDVTGKQKPQDPKKKPVR